MARVVSGTAVATIVAGVVLTYAGFRGVNPLAALRDVAGGKPPPIPEGHSDLDTGIAASGVGAAIAGASVYAGASPYGPALVAAAMKHAGERYSQTRRWQAGYSDCSSFVGKSLRDIGITPPPLSLAASYVTWNKLARVDRKNVSVGDLVANTSHIIISTGGGQAIGQQNSNQNVQRGTIESLMWGTGPFICLRLKLATGAAGAAAAGAGA